MTGENEVPSADEDIVMRVVAEAMLGSTPNATVLRVTKQLRIELSALRASWEKEKEIEQECRNLMRETLDAVKAEKQALEAEKKELEERVREQEYFIGSLHNYDGDAKRLLEETVAENRRLKAENEQVKEDYVKQYDKRLNADENFENLKTETMGYRAKIDSLTLALAEAREALEEMVSDLEDRNSEGNFSCLITLGIDALSNPTSQRASEEMKGLRKVVEAARLSNKECRKWRSNPDEKPCHEFKSLVDNDLLCHGCRLMNRIEALEAYESRGKV